ncbi:hypothetical protein V6B33_02490 [Mangrovibacillus sp. Mu-81]
MSLGYFFPDLDKTNEDPLLNLMPNGEGTIYNDDTPLNWENHNCEYFS